MDSYLVTYTLGVDVDAIDESQLKQQILASSSINAVCLDVGLVGSQIQISFDTRLASNEKIALDAIVRNFVVAPTPITSYATVNPSTGLIQHKVNNCLDTYLAAQPDEIYISKGGQTQYPTIQAAITANNRPNTIFVVYPGTYIENNPLILPPGSTIRGAGTPENTVIVAQNPNSNLIVMGLGSIVGNMTLVGTTTARAIYCDCSLGQGSGQFPIAILLIIVDCFIGIEADGKNMPGNWMPDTMYCDKVIIEARSMICGRGLSCINGGLIIGTTVQVRSTPPSLSAPNGFPFIYGSYCTGTNSKIALIAAALWFCQVASYVDNGGSFEPNILKYYYNGIGIQVGPNGTTSIVLGAAIDMVGTVQYNLDIQPTNAQICFSTGDFNDSMINNPNAVPLSIRFNSMKYNKLSQVEVGNFEFGTTTSPSKLFIGEGQYPNTGICVYSNSYLEEGVWTDNSVAALDTVSDFAIFSGTSLGNCIYLGSPFNIPGFKIETIVPTNMEVETSDIAWEYWNGTAWIQVSAMQTQAAKPCYTSLVSFVNAVGKYHIRFGITSATAMVAKTLNGMSKLWVRGRLLKDIDRSPQASYLKFHTNCQVINCDGFTEYFGDARNIRNALPGFNLTMSSSSEPASNQELFVSQKLSLGLKGNVFRAGQATLVGSRVGIPTNLDGSFPITVELAFVGSANTPGNVNWNFSYSTTREGDPVYFNSADAPTQPEYQVSTAVAVTAANQDTRASVTLDVSNFNINAADQKTSILWLSIERDASVDNNLDTYSGDIALFLVKGSYITWNNGSHLLGYN